MAKVKLDNCGKFIHLLILVSLFIGMTSQEEHNLLIPNRKVRHTRGKYSTKEEVIKRVEITHPCRPTRSSVKVTFPAMKDLLVSFIGYKEPRFMYVNRCKGLCSSEALGRVACVATKKRWKTINMQLKTEILNKNGKEKSRSKDLVLEEHVECACQCLSVTEAHCLRPDLFNSRTCSCACDRSMYHRDKLQCQSYRGRKWDESTCACVSENSIVDLNEALEEKSLSSESSSSLSDLMPSNRGVFGTKNGFRPLYDPPITPQNCHDCLQCLGPRGTVENIQDLSDYVTRHSWAILSVCLICMSVLAATTYYFWRKYKQLCKEMWTIEEEESNTVSAAAAAAAAAASTRIRESPLRKLTHTLESESLNRNTPKSSHDRRKRTSVSNIDSVYVGIESIETEINGGGKMTKAQKIHSKKSQKIQRKQEKKRKKQEIDALEANIKVHDPGIHSTTFLFGDELDPNFAN